MDFPFGRPRRDYKEKKRTTFCLPPPLDDTMPQRFITNWRWLLLLLLLLRRVRQVVIWCLRCSGDWCCVDCCCVCLSALSPPPFIVREGCWMLPSFILLRHSWKPGYLVAWHALCTVEVPRCLRHQALRDSDARLIFLSRLRTLSRLRILSRLEYLSWPWILSWLELLSWLESLSWQMILSRLKSLSWLRTLSRQETLSWLRDRLLVAW